MKKLNVSGEDLAGFLGMETGESPSQAQAQNMTSVKVEPDNADPEIKQKAEMIYTWLLRTDKTVMDKVYKIFETISGSEQNLNDIYELTNSNDEI
jgi:hypothetical protein